MTAAEAVSAARVLENAQRAVARKRLRASRQETMKVRSSVRKICVKCKACGGVVRIICSNQKHKQRQG